LTKNNNSFKSKDLQQQQTDAYKSAYKNNPKMTKSQPENLPDDLAAIVSVWPELPEHIKQAIKALVNSSLGDASR
jgi:deoxyadenosine/deoxycytidine kinase